MNSIQKYSRRGFLVAGGATVLTGVAVGIPPQRGTGDNEGSRLSSGGRVVKLISPRDGGYHEIMETLFPSLLQDPSFRLILPLTFLITNTSGPPIKAHSAIWSIVTPSDIIQKTWFFYFRSSIHNLLTARTNFLESGETRLVTPFFTWNSAEFKNNQSAKWNLILSRGEWPQYLAKQAQDSAEVGIQIEAAVYSDWTLIGSDKANLSQHLSVRRNAELLESNRMLKLVEDGISDDGLTMTLKRHQSIQGIVGRPIPRSQLTMHWHFKARTLQARVLESRLSQMGRTKFVSDLVAISNSHPVHVRPFVFQP